MVQPKYHGDLCWCHFSINLNFPGDWRISGMSTVEIWWRPFLNSFWKSPACSFWMLVFREFFGVEIYHWYISLLRAIFKKTIWWLCILSFVCVVLLILVFVVIWCCSKTTPQFFPKTSHLLHHLHHFRHSHGVVLYDRLDGGNCFPPNWVVLTSPAEGLSHQIIFAHTRATNQPKDGVVVLLDFLWMVGKIVGMFRYGWRLNNKK